MQIINQIAPMFESQIHICLRLQTGKTEAYWKHKVFLQMHMKRVYGAIPITIHKRYLEINDNIYYASL